MNLTSSMNLWTNVIHKSAGTYNGVIEIKLNKIKGDKINMSPFLCLILTNVYCKCILK